MVALAAAVLVVAAGGLAVVPTATAADGDLSGVAPIEQRNELTVTADGLPTVQIDSGIVWAQVMKGNVVYAGGSFSNTRPAGAAPGTNLTPRSNLLAFDVTTGQLLPFAPQIQGTVKALALSPDGSRLYVGGTFSKVGTVTRWNFAAFDTATGQLIANFAPAVGGSYVNSIVATDTTVYLGGLIGAASGVTRKNLAAVSTSGQLLGWAPTTDLQVDSMVLAPGGGKLVIAGRFATVNNVSQRGLAALDLTTGALLPWAVTDTVKNGRNVAGNVGKAGIWAVTADENNVYGTGWVFADVATGNLEGLFAAEGQSGDIAWIADCHGDHYGVYSDGTNVYSTSHEHECTTAGGLPQGNGTMRNATVYTAERKGTLSRSPYVNDIYADWSGYPAPAAVNWFPDWLTGTASGMGQAAWTVTGNDEYVVFGGEFIGVNNTRQQGLVRFARDPQGGAKQGPRLAGADWTGMTSKSVLPGSVAVSIPANWDRDDLSLTYELRKVGSATPLASASASSTFWNRPMVNLSASGLAAGSTQTLRVIARDGDGNVAQSSDVSVTVTSASWSNYATLIRDDGADTYWRLGGQSPLADWVGFSDAVGGSGVTIANDSAITGEAGSMQFNGSTNGTAAVPQRSANPPGSYSTELWFKAPSNSSGKLIGYGNAQSGNSGSYDRHVYLTDAGRLVFGTHPGGVRTVMSPSDTAYDDGQWHHMVATQGPDGMALYVDGEAVASDASVTSGEPYAGFWRIGGDNLGGWPNQPGNSYFSGQLDEVAIYDTVLTAQQVAQHYVVGTGATLSTAGFTVMGEGATRNFDAASSTTPPGRTITGYSWNFGDGTPVATTPQVSHTYADPGTFTVTLTITDSLGLTATKTAEVIVAPPHAPPTAAFAPTVAGLSVTFDASASVAAEGSTIAEHAWDFGDGVTSTDAAPTHRFAATGQYEVSLVVTDDTGAESTAVTETIEVQHAAPVAAFTLGATALTVTADAFGTTASDGATLTYSWNWGDGTPAGGGATATHAYGAAGTYTVTLTVTDSLGSTHTSSQPITVAAETFLAKDAFERTVGSGWGAAEIGGSWSGTAGMSVSDGAGKLSVGKSQTRTAILAGSGAVDFDGSLVFSADKVADGGGIHFNFVGHKDADGEYRAKLRISAAGVVTANLAKVVGTAETVLATKVLTGYTYTAGAKLHMRFSVDGSATATNLKAKVWPAGSAEPAAWTMTATNADAGLQGSGQFGVSSYGTGTITNGPVVVSVDDLIVKTAVAP